MPDIHLRAAVVPPDGVNDVRLYADGPDPPVVGGLILRSLMGVGLAFILAISGLIMRFTTGGTQA